jgi:hypothetical protein
MEFTGATITNQTFTRTIRDVTLEDDVYLRVRLDHPLRYSFSLTLSQTDAPDRVLLNVSGSPMPALGTLIEAAAQASAGVESSRAGAKQRADLLAEVPPADRTAAERRLDELTASLTRLENDLSRISNRLRQAAVVGGAESAIRDVVRILWPPDGGGPSQQLQQIRETLQPLTSTKARELEKRVSDLAQKTATLEGRIGAVSDALDEGDMCLYLGRFEAAKKVQVSATLTERPDLLAPPAEQALLRDAIRRTNALLERALEEGGDPETESTIEEADLEGPSPGPAPMPTPEPVERLTTSFEVMKPVHVHTSFGFPVTWLEENTYSLVTVSPLAPEDPPADASADPTTEPAEATPGMVELVPQTDQYRVLPTFFVALNLWPQYPFSTGDDDPYESVGKRNRRGLSITLGFPLQDIGKNYLFGVGYYVYRGIQVVAGIHLGRVTRLREGFEANEPFQKTDSNFQVSDATYTPYKASGYLGVTIDSSTIARIFGGGDQ